MFPAGKGVQVSSSPALPVQNPAFFFSPCSPEVGTTGRMCWKWCWCFPWWKVSVSSPVAHEADLCFRGKEGSRELNCLRRWILFSPHTSIKKKKNNKPFAFLWRRLLCYGFPWWKFELCPAALCLSVQPFQACFSNERSDVLISLCSSPFPASEPPWLRFSSLK